MTILRDFRVISIQFFRAPLSRAPARPVALPPRTPISGRAADEPEPVIEPLARRLDGRAAGRVAPVQARPGRGARHGQRLALRGPEHQGDWARSSLT